MKTPISPGHDQDDEREGPARPFSRPEWNPQSAGSGEPTLAVGQATVTPTGSGDLLGLEPGTTEKAGLISETNEDSNPKSFGSPLLGTNIAEHAEKLGKSSQRRSPKRVCYDKLLRESGQSSSGKSQNTVVLEHRGCYGKLLRDLPKGMLLRGRKLYYRHTVPVDAQPLLNRIEIWRSLRTDSLSVARRRLPSVLARIEMEIEHARAMAGLPVDATLAKPLQNDPAVPPATIELTPTTTIQPIAPITLEDAYRSYIDDPTRAWTANTRQAYETCRKLALAVMGASVPIASISRTHCRDLLDVLRFLPANAGKLSTANHRPQLIAK